MNKSLIICCLFALFASCNKPTPIVGEEPAPSTVIPPIPTTTVLVETINGNIYNSKLKGEDNPDKPHTWTAPDGSYSISNVGVHEYISISEPDGKGVEVDITLKPGYALLRYAYRFEEEEPSKTPKEDRKWKTINKVGNNKVLTSLFLHNTQAAGVRVPSKVQRVILCLEVAPTVKGEEAVVRPQILPHFSSVAYFTNPEASWNAQLTSPEEEGLSTIQLLLYRQEISIAMPPRPKGYWMPPLTGRIGDKKFSLSYGGNQKVKVDMEYDETSKEVKANSVFFRGSPLNIPPAAFRSIPTAIAPLTPKIEVDPPYSLGAPLYTEAMIDGNTEEFPK